MTVPPKEMRPMETFDPSELAILHDALNDKIITWLAEPEPLANFRKYATLQPDGTIEWDGLILDGWGNVLGG